MSYFVDDRVGLTIAALNTATFITLCYAFLKAVEERSRLLHVLDRIYSPVLSPMRRILPAWKIDVASLIFAALLQVAAFIIKRRSL